MLFVTAFARTVARSTAALRVRNTEVSVIGIRYTSGRLGNVVRARCRVKVALRHTALFCACVHWYGTCTTFARYTLAELCAQSPEVPRGVMVRA